MANNPSTTTKVITGMVRFSYLHVFEPHAIEEGQEKKYSVSLLIPKSDTKTVELIQQAVRTATEQARAKMGGKLPPKFKLPLNDGDLDRPDDPDYAGHYYVNASAKTRPGVVDKNLQPIIDPEEMYSGCYGRASITFYPFDKAGNRGVACGLNNVQKLKDGEYLGGRTSAENDFADPFVEGDPLESSDFMF